MVNWGTPAKLFITWAATHQSLPRVNGMTHPKRGTNFGGVTQHTLSNLSHTAILVLISGCDDPFTLGKLFGLFWNFSFDLYPPCC